VIDHIDDNRLDRLYRIGVDEISHKRGQKYLTIVADQDTGNVVWVGKERSKAAFEEFFTALGPRRAATIEAISLDGSSVYLPVTREQTPQARICLDPFHVIKSTNEVVDSVYRALDFRGFVDLGGGVCPGQVYGEGFLGGGVSVCTGTKPGGDEGAS
jgi:transposase